MSSNDRNEQDYGSKVSTIPAAHPDKSIPMKGTYVTLMAWDQSYVPSLWHHWSVDPTMLDHVLSPPMHSEDDLRRESESMVDSKDPICYAVLAHPSHLNPSSTGAGSTAEEFAHSEVIGMVFYGHISTSDRVIEIGALLGPALRRTAAATEIHYLLLKNVLDEGSPVLGGRSPPYRRVSWKCSRLNTRSRNAALRLGYLFEGTNRQMQIVNGRSRDEDVFSMLDSEWAVNKDALEQWLGADNFDETGMMRRRLGDIREQIVKETE